MFRRYADTSCERAERVERSERVTGLRLRNVQVDFSCLLMFFRCIAWSIPLSCAVSWTSEAGICKNTSIRVEVVEIMRLAHGEHGLRHELPIVLSHSLSQRVNM